MNNKFEVGNRIIYTVSSGKEFPSEIMEILKINHFSRYKISIINSKTIIGNEVITWVGSKDIKYDYSYYRDLKINKILNE